MSKWQALTGVWEQASPSGQLSMDFKWTAELAERFRSIPEGTFVKLYMNEKKADNPKAPDWNMTYKIPEEAATEAW